MGALRLERTQENSPKLKKFTADFILNKISIYSFKFGTFFPVIKIYVYKLRTLLSIITHTKGLQLLQQYESEQRKQESCTEPSVIPVRFY